MRYVIPLMWPYCLDRSKSSAIHANEISLKSTHKGMNSCASQAFSGYGSWVPPALAHFFSFSFFTTLLWVKYNRWHSSLLRCVVYPVWRVNELPVGVLIHHTGGMSQHCPWTLTVSNIASHLFPIVFCCGNFPKEGSQTIITQSNYPAKHLNSSLGKFYDFMDTGNHI